MLRALVLTYPGRILAEFNNVFCLQKVNVFVRGDCSGFVHSLEVGGKIEE